MKDVFGQIIYIGDTLLFADVINGDEPTLDMYEIVEIDGNVATGERKSGRWIGEHFYLEGVENRGMLIKNPYKSVGLRVGQILH